MGDDEFWRIIEASRRYGAAFEDTFDGRREGLAAELRRLAPDRIAAFADAYLEKQDRAYRWDLLGAAYLLGGGCSDDGFKDFRSWLISLGRDRFERALKDPDTLAEVAFGPGEEQDVFFEELAYVALRVHEEITGEKPPLRPWKGPRDPEGKPWREEDELEARLPRLWKAAEEEDE